MLDLMKLTWPVEQLGEAIEAIAQRRGLPTRSTGGIQSAHPFVAMSEKHVSTWIEAAASSQGLEAESVEVTYVEIENLVRSAGPALLRLPSNGNQERAGFLLLLGRRRRTVALLSPDLVVHRLRHDALIDAFRLALEQPVESGVTELLRRAGVAGRRQSRARTAILREQLGQMRIHIGWILRFPASASLWQQIREAHLTGSLVAPVSLHIFQYVLTLLAWWLLGKNVLNGQFDRGWLIAWALLLLTAVPFQLLATSLHGRFAIGAAGILKRKLLHGALRLEPEEIRHKGAGQLLGEIIESSNIETFALNGGFLALVATIELVLAIVVLSLGAGGGLSALLLCGWAGFGLLLCRKYYRRCRDWTSTRLTMTNDLVERMVGHRTRLAQESRDRWHDDEDQSLESYLNRSIAMDLAAMLQAMIPRGWLVVGMTGLAPSLISGGGSSASLAIALGGTLLGYRALQKLVSSWSSLTSASIAWQQVAHLSHAASRVEESGALINPIEKNDRVDDAATSGRGRAMPRLHSTVVMDAHDLSFRYRQAGDPVLNGCHLRVHEGGRLLLTGTSGSGKSTLAALLTGLRSPESGLLLLNGLDKQTLGGREWRKQVAAAPQFHENHVLTGTFAFNLLMGREWPPSGDDLIEAETICRELGLGDLLERMPAGLQQMVGETGWQLSHGERSRLFLARALLQRGKMTVLDESFGALDGETLRLSLRCAFERADTLLVIAHP